MNSKNGKMTLNSKLIIYAILFLVNVIIGLSAFKYYDYLINEAYAYYLPLKNSNNHKLTYIKIPLQFVKDANSFIFDSQSYNVGTISAILFTEGFDKGVSKAYEKADKSIVDYAVQRMLKEKKEISIEGGNDNDKSYIMSKLIQYNLLFIDSDNYKGNLLWKYMYILPIPRTFFSNMRNNKTKLFAFVWHAQERYEWANFQLFVVLSLQVIISLFIIWRVQRKKVM